MRRLAAILLALLFATPAFAQDFIALTPEQIGQIFCISRLGNDMAPVEGILTPGLTQAIAEAEARDAAFSRENPGDKPPLGDGLPWQAGPDYAAECTVGQVGWMMDEASVKIAYGFPEYPAGNYADTLMLKLIPGQYGEKVWRIDNIVFADGDMRTVLVSAFLFN